MTPEVVLGMIVAAAAGIFGAAVGAWGAWAAAGRANVLELRKEKTALIFEFLDVSDTLWTSQRQRVADAENTLAGERDADSGQRRHKSYLRVLEDSKPVRALQARLRILHPDLADPAEEVAQAVYRYPNSADVEDAEMEYHLARKEFEYAASKAVQI